MGRKSRAKGAAGELAVSRILSSWWCGDPSLLKQKAAALPLRRTPLSGGWSEGADLRGDLVPVWEDEHVRSFAQMCVEVKNAEDWTLDAIMQDRCAKFAGWWSQANSQAATHNRLPVLVFTRNLQPWHVAIPSRTARHLPRISPMLVTGAGSVVFLLDDFTDRIEPAELLALLKQE